MPLIIGTAGHIDHGKTALVRALTGQDTDRLPEEQARGISIDLGFAWMDGPAGERAAIVDVPGHERFIRNMLAGAHAVDCVLFTVAADDGVMPQSEEHLDILHLLGVRRGIFVITKTDLVEPARVEAVREEIEILALGTTLEGAPVVPCSAATGAGLERLREAIGRQLGVPGAGRGRRRFRMPIDRAFVVRGHGIVVTGSVVAGTVAEGNVLRVLPGGETARVRGLEVHGEAVPHAGARQRVAINLAGAERAEVGRGHVVCDPRIERASARFDAWAELRPGARRGVHHHGRIRLHLGTAETFAKIVLLDRRPLLAPGAATWVQVVPETPVAAMRGDRFVLRDETARWTIGGGVVVHPAADRHRQAPAALPGLLQALRGDDVPAAVGAFLELAPEFALAPPALATWLDLDDDAVAAGLAGAVSVVALPDDAAPQVYTTAAKWTRFEAAVLERVRAAHAAEPLSPGLDLESLRAQLPWPLPGRVFRWAVERLVRGGALVRDENVLRLPAHRVALAAERRALAARLESLLRAGHLTPPDVGQLAAATGTTRAGLLEVLGVLEQEARVVRVAPELFYHPDAVAEGTRRLAAHCRAHGEITAAAFRDLIGASRKFAIAFLDWSDRTGVTMRVGDARRLRR